MINSELKNLNIDIITKLNIKKSTVNKLHKLKIKTIGDLDKVEIDIVQSIIEADQTTSFSSFSKALELNLIDFTNKIGESITEDPAYNMALLHINNRTYHEIAKKYDLSKEKVTQAIDKFLQSFYPIIDALGDKLIENKSYIVSDEIESIIEYKEFSNIIILAFKAHDTKWIYNHQTNFITKKL